MGINYSIDTFFIVNYNYKKINVYQKDSQNGYSVEIRMPNFFNKECVRFNLIITDIVKKLQEEGLDVFIRWESEMGWGVNAYREDVSERYGYLKFK